MLHGLPFHTETIAQWSYTAEEWRKFSLYESRHFQKMGKQTKTVFVVFLTFTIIALILVPLFGVLGWAPWDRSMFVAVFLILLFGGGILGICMIVGLMQKSKLSTLMAATGEVVITSTGIGTSGIWHRWNYEDLLGRRFYDARTFTIKEGQPDAMEILEVRTIANTQGAGSARDVISSCRVPIPAGKRPVADLIVSHLIEEKARSIK